MFFDDRDDFVFNELARGLANQFSSSLSCEIKINEIHTAESSHGSIVAGRFWRRQSTRAGATAGSGSSVGVSTFWRVVMLPTPGVLRKSAQPIHSIGFMATLQFRRVCKLLILKRSVFCMEQKST